MCPEPHLLSIYFDGELPSPWKEKMHEHFAHCPKCREKYDNYRQLHDLFMKDTKELTEEKQSPEEVRELVNTAKERVWRNINTRRRFKSRYNLLQRKLSIPLPAAAAAVVLLLLTVFWLRAVNTSNQKETGENSNFILAAEMERIDEMPGIIPAADMTGMLQYLSPSSTNIIILQLPESTSFFSSGEPEIIRAADYQRREVSRRHSRRHTEETLRTDAPRRRP